MPLNQFCFVSGFSAGRRIVSSLYKAYLRLNGVNAKEHPVFRELTRVKQYFEKIKTAESADDGAVPTAQLDKAAVGRFINHALVRISSQIGSLSVDGTVWE